MKDPNELTEQERQAFHNLLYLFMNPIEAVVLAPGAPLTDATSIGVVIDVDMAGFRDWWKVARRTYSKTFRDQVDEQLRVPALS